MYVLLGKKIAQQKCILPVFLRGPSPNKSLTTARALSERDSTSFSSSWSENTCAGKTIKKKNSNKILFEITNNRGDGMLKSNGRAADPAHLPDDAETGLVQGRGAPTLSQTELQGFLPQFPLSRSRVVGLVNLMAMVLVKKRQVHNK